MKTLMRRLFLAPLLALPAASLLAENPPPPPLAQKQPAPVIKPNLNPQTQPPPRHTGRVYLGVFIRPTIPGPGALQPGSVNPQPSGSPTGLVVVQVVPDSPADKAGIKAGDTLLAFGDQKLVAADQLGQLVRGEAPQHQVTIELLRDGKSQKVPVTLAEAPAGPPGFPPRDLMQPRGPMGRLFGPGMGPMMPGWNFGSDLSSVWQKFESLALKKTGDDKFRVEVNYVEADAKTNKSQPKKYTFEGTPEEIHRAIEESKDLTPPERFQLHRMLSFPGLERGFPSPSSRPGSGAAVPPRPGLDETPSK